MEYRGGTPDDPEYFQPMLGVVTRRHKYTRYLLSGEEELYDLVADPLETKNLAAAGAPDEALSACRQRVDRFRDTIRRPFWNR